ncbi:hypothetical protein K450DRAFT_261400 [Umbelopsis ramanniana AG]|uniref:Uncharacterized protein n=1 Tax=Umbelopsis ramanniana AG TaxID=1314678 RepID=A0AAD5HAI0_UMBRA|nr:uncharacterized protein K450DRAFT_261400 [Umbelopsis ramanniana AG]KAI8575536.1 hypothetical protein K450DRAFT_261400 [Umbelopsis ramanniana AG]
MYTWDDYFAVILVALFFIIKEIILHILTSIYKLYIIFRLYFYIITKQELSRVSIVHFQCGTILPRQTKFFARWTEGNTERIF